MPERKLSRSIYVLREVRGRPGLLQALSKPVFILIVLAILIRINRINDSGALGEC